MMKTNTRWREKFFTSRSRRASANSYEHKCPSTNSIAFSLADKLIDFLEK